MCSFVSVHVFMFMYIVGYALACLLVRGWSEANLRYLSALVIFILTFESGSLAGLGACQLN